MDQQQKSPGARFGSKWRNGRPALKWVVIGVGVLIIAAVAGLLLYKTPSDKPSQNSAAIKPAFVCGDAIVEKANPIINDNDLTGYLTLVDTIKAKDGYDRDVNCQYIIARYSLAVADVDNSEKSIAAIRQQMSSNQYNYSDVFNPAALSPDELENALKSVKLNAERKQKELSQDTTIYDKQ